MAVIAIAIIAGFAGNLLALMIVDFETFTGDIMNSWWYRKLVQPWAEAPMRRLGNIFEWVYRKTWGRGKFDYTIEYYNAGTSFKILSHNFEGLNAAMNAMGERTSKAVAEAVRQTQLRQRGDDE